MGQKVHPLGFRVGLTQNYQSTWFTNLNNYSNLLFQDHIIRQTIQDYFNKVNLKKNSKTVVNLLNIINIEIKRKFDYTDIIVSIASTKKVLADKSLNNSEINETIISNDLIDKLHASLLKKLISLFQKNNLDCSKLILTIQESSELETNANFIAKCLIDDLENRIPFRRALKNILNIAQKQRDLFGIKIRVSGRLNGIEMARSEWIREGRIPLQTLTANIDYCNDIAHTKYGLLGVKVWVYKK
uniref:Small ribosomal subunit protein uS3c n=1 Tax=Gymnochlora stellata TaxID=67809 RepID=A0A140JZF7_GYMST|nr:30S ribosomal protein S3 [Gymnochlora stellata]BAU62484.1 30S ribosomal protein S3 [Gymnochlora stellata]